MKKVTKNIIRLIIPSEFRHKIWKTFTKIRFFGFRYKCPFCNSYLRTFLPSGLKFPVLKKMKVIGGGYRKNVLCPVCDSQDRERLLYLYLKYKTKIFSERGKLLHIGPELRLEEIFKYQENLDYLTADIDPKGVMVKMDIRDINFPNNSFDYIICNHVLEHVDEDIKAMSELYRTLRPGGWAILQVPLSEKLKKTYEDFSINTVEGKEAAFGQGDHVRIYADDYLDRLTHVGFKVSVFKWVNESENFGGSKNYFGLNKKERVYFVEKL